MLPAACGVGAFTLRGAVDVRLLLSSLLSPPKTPSKLGASPLAGAKPSEVISPELNASFNLLVANPDFNAAPAINAPVPGIGERIEAAAVTGLSFAKLTARCTVCQILAPPLLLACLLYPLMLVCQEAQPRLTPT